MSNDLSFMLPPLVDPQQSAERIKLESLLQNASNGNDDELMFDELDSHHKTVVEDFKERKVVFPTFKDVETEVIGKLNEQYPFMIHNFEKLKKFLIVKCAHCSKFVLEFTYQPVLDENDKVVGGIDFKFSRYRHGKVHNREKLHPRQL